MDRHRLRELLDEVRSGRITTEEALERVAALPFFPAEDATLDTHRELRTGFPEAIYAGGKTPDQVARAAAALAASHDRVLVTRASESHHAAVAAALPEAVFRPLARCVLWRAPGKPPPEPAGRVAIVAAGTSDLPVAEEAACTLEAMDVAASRVADVGVAGLHRLLAHLAALRQADALIVCAGMEGALPSVVGGLVEAPVVAVPTGVGYGASFGGLAALLAMLNSCAPGVAVVNVDNGFGAALVAGRIARLAARGMPRPAPPRPETRGVPAE